MAGYQRRNQPGLRGSAQSGAEKPELEYRTALARHRAGRHDLFDWYAQVGTAAEPMWVEFPPLPDVYEPA